MEKNNVTKSIVIAACISIVSMSFSDQVINAAHTIYSTIREIVGLKCPGHEHLKDSHNFMYQEVNGNPSTSYTRCMRCHYTKGVHKAQQ